MTITINKQRNTLAVAHFNYEKTLNSYAFFKVHNHEIGEDLVQDTFLKTWKFLLKGGDIVSMKSFLYHVLNNLIIDQYRRHKTSSLDALVEKGFEPSIDLTKHMINMFDGKKAMLLIKYLPKKYERVVTMRYIEHLSVKEISTKIGQSENTTAVQVHRGLSKLRIMMEVLK